MVARRRVFPLQERIDRRRTRLESSLAWFVERCRALPDVRAVYVFGSMATGKLGPNSDLDLLVVRDTPIESRIERAVDLVAAYRGGVGLDVIVVTPEEFEQRLPASSFGQTLLGTSRLVYAA